MNDVLAVAAARFLTPLMTPKVLAGADLKRSETGVSEKNLRCISGTSAFRISRYQHY